MWRALGSCWPVTVIRLSYCNKTIWKSNQKSFGKYTSIREIECLINIFYPSTRSGAKRDSSTLSGRWQPVWLLQPDFIHQPFPFWFFSPESLQNPSHPFLLLLDSSVGKTAAGLRLPVAPAGMFVSWWRSRNSFLQLWLNSEGVECCMALKPADQWQCSVDRTEGWNFPVFLRQMI